LPWTSHHHTRPELFLGSEMADDLDVKDEHHDGHEDGVDDEVFTPSSLSSTLPKQLGV
jgi:hypothetical protein